MLSSQNHWRAFFGFIPVCLMLFTTCKTEKTEENEETGPLSNLTPGVWTEIAGNSSTNTSAANYSAYHSDYFPVSATMVLRSARVFRSASSGYSAWLQRSYDGGFTWAKSGVAGSFYRFYWVNNDTLALVFLDDGFLNSSLYYSYDGGVSFSGLRTHDPDPTFTYRSNFTKAIDFSKTGIPYLITETEWSGFYLGKIVQDSIHFLLKDSLYNFQTGYSKTEFLLSTPNDKSLFFIRTDPDSSALYTSQDSGQTFQTLPLPSGDLITALIFRNDKEGFLATGKGSGQIYHSQDGGATWQLLNQSFPSGIKTIHQQFGKFYLLSFDSKVYESTNGFNWTLFTEVPVSDIEHFLFLGAPDNGFVTTEGALYRIRN